MEIHYDLSLMGVGTNILDTNKTVDKKSLRLSKMKYINP